MRGLLIYKRLTRSHGRYSDSEVYLCTPSDRTGTGVSPPLWFRWFWLACNVLVLSLRDATPSDVSSINWSHPHQRQFTRKTLLHHGLHSGLPGYSESVRPSPPSHIKSGFLKTYPRFFSSERKYRNAKCRRPSWLPSNFYTSFFYCLVLLCFFSMLYCR